MRRSQSTGTAHATVPRQLVIDREAVKSEILKSRKSVLPSKSFGARSFGVHLSARKGFSVGQEYGVTGYMSSPDISVSVQAAINTGNNTLSLLVLVYSPSSSLLQGFEMYDGNASEAAKLSFTYTTSGGGLLLTGCGNLSGLFTPGPFFGNPIGYAQTLAENDDAGLGYCMRFKANPLQ
jgi:hypothetical protein